MALRATAAHTRGAGSDSPATPLAFARGGAPPETRCPGQAPSQEAPGASRPESKLARAFSLARPGLLGRALLCRDEQRLLQQLLSCRTGALGESGVRCSAPACDYLHRVFHSCRDRHCPFCGNLDQERWMERLREKLLDLPHYHVVLTLPSELRPLGRRHPMALYEALSRAGSASLASLGERFGVTLGVITVLHTWTRDLRYHPHLHAIVTSGGLCDDGSFRDLTEKALFPNDLLAEAFRSEMLGELRALADLIDERVFDPPRDSLLGLPENPPLPSGLGPRPRRRRRWGIPGKRQRAPRPRRDPCPQPKDPLRFEAWLKSLTRMKLERWVVYAKVSLRAPNSVVDYLGRYTRRIAISESRVLRVTPHRVVFTTKHGRTATLTPEDFTRRFLLHMLPAGFTKLRHYGLYAGANATRKLPLAREALRRLRGVEPARRSPAVTDALELLARLTGRDTSLCPKCGAKLLPLVQVRGPPFAGGWAA